MGEPDPPAGAAEGDGWRPAWPPPAPPPGEAHVWRVALALDEEPELAGLDPAERARALAFRFAIDRRRWAWTRLALRALLGAMTGVPPGMVSLAVDRRGKPHLAGPGPAFNVAHADAWALIALAADRPVGVDVEPARPLPDLHAMALATLGPGERAAWDALPAEARVAAFYRAWTRKEALLKARGDGLGFPLPAAEVGLGPLGTRVVPLEGATWVIADLDPAPDVAGAVAASGEAIAVRTFSFPAVLGASPGITGTA